MAAEVLAAGFIGSVSGLLPFALAMAAGAMIFVVVEELLPEAYRLNHGNQTAGGACIGALVVIVLGSRQ